jgi:hypothetical protein
MANSAILNSYHPYYPAEAQIVGYLANEWSVPTLLALFAILWALILGISLWVVSQIRPNLRKADKIAILWFILSMFVLNPSVVEASYKTGQPEVSISSSKAISSLTISGWPLPKISLDSSGRSTLSRTQDT